MKLIHILTLILIGLMTNVLAQRGTRCAGRPRNPSCSGARDVGRRGLRCGERNMFYYDAAAGQCRRMRYRGCGGNSNRWCSMAHCQRTCNR